MSSSIVFLKCYFCQKSFNKTSLIDMSGSSVLINEENVEFRNLIFDTCFIHIDESKPNLICTECNNTLVSFHMFKRDAKKYSNFNKFITLLEVLSKLEKFLSCFEDITILNITESSTKWCIQQENITELPKETELIIYDPEELDETACDDSLDRDDVSIAENITTSSVKENNFIDHEINDEHLQWIQNEANDSKILKDRIKRLKCTVCYASLPTLESLEQHLRDIHILAYNKFESNLDIEELTAFNLVVQKCKVYIGTVNNECIDSFYKCLLCSKLKSYKTEQTFKAHLGSCHPYDLDLITIDQVEPFECNWQCAECNVIYNSPESFKAHLRNDHNNENETEIQQLEVNLTESELDVSKPKKRRLNTLNDLDTDQVEWIKKQVSNSDFLKGRKKFFKCPECQVVLCTQASLIRHLRDLHLLKNPTDEKAILKDEVTKSKLIIDTENGQETVWKCSRCERDRIYKSEQSFKLHFRMKHIRDKKIDSSYIANCKTTTMIENEGIKDVWKCPECSKIFKHRDGLRHHLKSVHPGLFVETKSESNDIADRSIQDISRLTEKVMNKNVSKGENFCNECGVKFIHAKHHVRPKIHQECHEVFKVLAPNMPHFKCDKCRTIFNSEISLSEHLEFHNNPELINLIPTEGLITFGASYYKEAVGDADEACLDEAVWKCGHCTVRYFDENDCVVHQLLLHTTTIYCFVDNRYFQGLSGLSKYLQHMKNKHPEFFPNISYTCSSCKMKFPTIYEKLAHQKVCDLKSFECDYCGKRYSAKHQLQAHILFELGISGFSCEVCGKKCKTMSDLKIHQNIHTGLRPYICSLCDKSFKTPAARSNHIEKHVLEEGITCEICNSKLTNRTLYQRHKRFQHDEEFRNSQYEKNTCTVCDKSFLRNSHFKQHLKQHH